MTKINNFLEKKWLHLSLIILLTFGVYANSFRNAFVYDDEVVIVNNDFIKDWKTFPKILTKDYFTLAQELTYRPVSTLSFFIDYSLWKLNVFGWHLTNISFHTANAILVYLLTYLLFSYLFTSSLHHSIAALITALLFALHPIQTEAVDGISFREDLISFFFFLLAFIFYIKSNQLTSKQTNKPANYFFYVFSCISFILALFSKEMAITLPFILILYDYCFTHDTLHIKYSIRNYFAYFLIIGLYFLSKNFLLKPTGFIEGREGIDISVPLPYLGNSFYVSIITMITAISRYLKLVLMPTTLSIVYDNFPIYRNLLNPVVIISIILLLIIFVILYFSSKEISFSILYFFIALIPVSNLIPFGAIMAERYLYFPSLGFCLFLTIITMRFVKIEPNAKRVTLYLIALLIVFYSLRTIKRNNDYREGYTLWSETIKVSPNSKKAHFNLGLIYSKKGLYDNAIAEYEKTIKIEPRYASAYYNLGLAYHLRDQLEQAIFWYNKTLKINPKYAKAYNNLGVIYQKMGWLDYAITAYKKALEIDHTFPDAVHNLKIVQSMKNIGELENK